MREVNPTLAGKQNMRDYTSIPQLTVLSNLETYNAELIKQGVDKQTRFEQLKQIAEHQLRVLAEADTIQSLPGGDENYESFHLRLLTSRTISVREALSGGFVNVQNCHT